MILYAPNINSGGGLVLLNTVIEDEVFGKVTTLFIDSRCPINNIDLKYIEIIKVEPTIWNRLKAEVALKNIAKIKNEVIMCFGNLPPVVRHKNKTFVFLQNAYLLKNLPLPKNIKLRIRTIYERFILYYFSKNADEFIVQTNWMKESLQKFCKIKIITYPLIPKLPELPHLKTKTRKFDILAITGAEEHKNLDLLISLLESYNKIIKVFIICPKEIKITNKKIELIQHKNLPREELYKTYQNSKYLITLSSFESFCLPIYEAYHFGTKNIVLNDFYIDNKKVIYRKIKDISSFELPT